MFSLFGNKKINAFGLDVSDVSIKVMQLKAEGEGYLPQAYSDVSLSPNVINNHVIVNQTKLASDINRAITSAGKIDTRYVVASVPEAKSFVRTLLIPSMPEQEIETAIPFELEQDIPVPVDQVYLDWQLVGESNDKMQILVTATPKDYVDSLVETLKLASLKPVALELESVATARSLVSAEDAKQSVLILDLATMQTSFIIVSQGILEYTSNIPIAGNAFSESIARNLGIPTAEAEKLKREVGLVSESKKSNVRQAILPILDNIVDEIKNVVRFHEEHVSGKPIKKILLCGGSARLLGIADYISARLNLGATRPIGRVTLGDPFVNFASKSVKMSKDQALGFSTVAGLALRGMKA